MALTATLKIGNKAYSLVDYKWKMTCPHNESRPDGMTRCEYLELSVVSPGKADLTLMNWYVSQSSETGSIEVQMDDSGSPVMKKVLFENALCYAIAETYHIDKYVQRALRLSLAVESLTVDDIEFTAEL